MNNVKRPMVRQEIYDSVSAKGIDDEPFAHTVERVNREHSELKEMYQMMVSAKAREIDECNTSLKFYQLMLFISGAGNFTLVIYLFMTLGIL
jgi:hypothetical protein